MKFCRISSVFLLFLGLQGTAQAVSVRDVTYSTKNVGTVVFSHADHINKKAMSKNCRACHDALFDLKKKKSFSMADMKRGKSCGACHEGKKAFSLQECARCHQTKDKIFTVPATGQTRFKHAKHLAQIADCSICHPALFATGQNKRFSMADMEKGKSCGACHNGTQAFGLDSCVVCHPVKEITYQVRETGPTRFSHKSHISVAECGSCHPKLYSLKQKNRRVGMTAMTHGKSCGACHDSKQAFSVKECAKCHPTGELLFEEKSTGNVIFSHTSHTALYRCGDCHAALYTTARSTLKVSMQSMEKGKSCGSCHEGKTAFSVQDKCEVCHKM
jgi:c(7)-type cytochrome triheme protein